MATAKTEVARRAKRTGVRKSTASTRVDGRNKSKVGQHPDRPIIEMLLGIWPLSKVEAWLFHRYPPRDDARGIDLPEHAALRITRATLREYRDKFLRPDWADGWLEPMEGSTLEAVLPPMPPREVDYIELESLGLAIQAAEMTVARCLVLDGRAGIVADTTIQALKVLADICEQRAMLAGKLGVPGYEIQAERHEVRVDQRTAILRGEIPTRPLEPEKFALASALAALPEDKRRSIMGAPLKTLNPGDLIEDLTELAEAHAVVTLDPNGSGE